jgi:hypothetical protein
MSGMVEGCPIKLKDERSLVLCVGYEPGSQEYIA